MAPSTSSGQKSNKGTIPHEIRGRMTWDSDYRKQYEKQHPFPDESESESDHDNGWDEEYPRLPYVSGGQSTTGLAGGSSSTSTTTNPNGPNPSGVAHNFMGSDEFQRVLYKHRKGQHTNGKQFQKSRVPRRANLNLNKDNFGKSCFRKRDPPSGKFVLHKDCNEIEPDKVKIYDYLEELGVRLGSFIRPPQTVKDRTLLLWGKSDAVGKTVRELQEWVRPSTPRSAKTPRPTGPRTGDKFVKTYSVIGDHYKADQAAIRRKAELQKFQQVPEKGQLFDYGGTFLWPVEEVRPQDILGDGLEAMDPVRTANKCHIIFDDQHSVFKIFTDKLESVKQTLSRIEGIMKEYVARTNRPVTRYYIEPSDTSAHRNDVSITPSQSSGPTPSGLQIPTSTGKPLELEESAAWIRLRANLISQSSRGVEDALKKTIPNLVYYRGHVRMRVHFGTFALTVFRWPGTAPSIPFKDFMKNMAMSGTKGTMIRDLYIRNTAAAILEKIRNATDLLQPIDNQIMALVDVTPSFTAYFECHEDEKGPLKLEVEMNENAMVQNLYERTHSLWSKMGRGDNTNPLDISMIRLDGGPSWKLRASSENYLDSARITPKMVQFMDSVTLKKAPNTTIELSGEKVFHWGESPDCMRVMIFLQKTSLRFRLVKNMDFMLEIARYDTYGDQEGNVSVHTDWGATLSNSEWDAALMANGNLGIGQSANWDPRLRTFFPSQSVVSTDQGVDEGVMDFLNIVREVNGFLNDLKQATKEELPNAKISSLNSFTVNSEQSR